MSDTNSADPLAWQPLTFGGVAAFARARISRLLLVQLVFALVFAAATVWVVSHAWFPTIRQAIQNLPAQGEVRNGMLMTPDPRPRLLSEGRFLAISVDLEHRRDVRSPAHVQVEFGRESLRLISLLGYADVPYPGAPWILEFNRPKLEPWWGAWQPPILWITFGTVTAGLMIAWAVLASLWCWIARIMAFLSDRRLSWLECWKIAGAGLMPGGIVMTGVLFLYGVGFLDLVQLGAAWLLHLAIGMIYAAASPLAAVRSSAKPKSKNPFAAQ